MTIVKKKIISDLSNIILIKSHGNCVISIFTHDLKKMKNINVIGNVTESEVNSRHLFFQCIYDSKMFFEHIGHNICATKL